MIGELQVQVLRGWCLMELDDGDAFAAKFDTFGTEGFDHGRGLQLLADYLHEYAVAFAV